MSITTQTLAERLATRLVDQGVALEDATAFAEAFAGDLTEWLGGEGAVPAALASRVSATAAAWNADVMQRLDWWTGPADGGPNGDGLYPMVNAAGVETMFPSLAKILDSTAKGNAGWTAKTVIEPDGATRAVVRILDWVGGEGTKPATGYVADDGSLVGTAAAARDVFGAISTTLTGFRDTAQVYRDSAVAARDEVRQVTDRSSEMFFAALAVIHAFVDVNGRGAFLTEDGKLRGDLGVENGVNITKTYDAEKGVTTFSLPGLTSPLSVNGAGTIAAQDPIYFAGLAVLHALLDANDRGIFLTEDGKLRGELGVDNGVNITKTFNAATGITTFSLPGLTSPLSINGAGTLEASSELYTLNQQILCGFLDSANKIWAAGLEDGSFYIPKLLAQLPLLNGVNGVQVSFDATTGKTTISLGTTDGVLPFSGGGAIESSSEWFVDGYDAGVLLADVARKVWAAGLLDGRFYVPKLLVGQLETTGGVVGTMQPGLDAADGMYTVQTVSGQQQIIRHSKSTGIKSQLTTLGNNTAPFALSDGTGFAYSSDRAGTVRQFWQPYGGGAETLMVSTSDLTLWGDSRTIGLFPYMQAGAAGRTVYGQGGSGQKSPEIAGRSVGAIQVTIAGGSIPASGPVNVTAITPDVFYHWDSTQGAIHCVIAGIPGTLTYDTSATPKSTFVRDTAGSVVAVATPVACTLDSARVLGSLSAAGAPALSLLRQTTAIFAPGYNDLQVGYFLGGYTYSRAALLANIAAMIDAQTCKVKRFLVPSIYLGEHVLVNGGGGLAAGQSTFGGAPDAATSKAMIDEAFAVRDALAAAYPGRFVDMHARLIAAGFGQDATVAGSTYTILNTACLPDGIHAGNTGNLAKVAIYNDELSQRGY